MTELRHTPDPWVRDGHNLSTILHCTAERGSPEAKHICGDYEVIAECEGENWDANSLAIVALPDLLGAMREIDRLFLVIESAVRNSDPQRHAAVLEALKENRAAINKATVKP